MKKFYLPALIAVFITGCSSASTVSNVETNAAKSSVPNAANAPSNAATNQTVVSPSNSQPNLPPPNTAANPTNSNLPLIQSSAVSRENLERLKSKGFGNKNAPPIPSVKATPNTAPDNSEISSTMNAKGIPVETRTFKNNPTLLKLEKTFEDLSHPITKVYLKNGKVLTVPKDAIADPENATGDEILRAVGVKP